MRIIAGEFKGRHLAGPEGSATRPMLDRVREALFSSLGETVVDARVLDLFAGTGSLGLEALSRGARAVRFVERDRRALRRLLENVAELGVEERVHAALGDALDPRRWGDGPYELVFLDPPYPMWSEHRGRAQLLATLDELARAALAPGGWILLHTHPRDLGAEELPAGWEAERRDYGNSALWYLSPGVG